LLPLTRDMAGAQRQIKEFILVIEGVILAAVCFSILAEILSGPLALV